MKCKGCENRFKPISRNQKFCTKDCCRTYYVPIINKITNERNREITKSVFIRFHKDRSARKCLSCGHNFKSEGSYNRVCISCKRKPEFSWDFQTHG